MKKVRFSIVLFFASLLLLVFEGSVIAEDTAGSLFSLSHPLKAEEQTVNIDLSLPLSDLQVNVLAGEKILASTAQHEGSRVVINLTRSLAEGEHILVVLEGTSDDGDRRRGRLEATVAPVRASKLQRIRSRMDDAWSQWETILDWTVKNEKVCLPFLWKDIPFITWADEAPEISVHEEAGSASIYLYDEDLTGWTVMTGEGIPIQYHDCLWDRNTGAYLCSDPFDAVYLISDASDTRFSITIAYERSSDFLPSYPVIEWSQERKGTACGFSCYGWGTTRTFSGGMYNIVAGNLMIYGEYGSDGSLVSWNDLLNDTLYDADGKLLSGEEPEGYICPVVH